MPLGAFLDFGAGLCAAVDESEQAAHLIERKAEFAGAEDETQTRDVRIIVDTVARSCAPGVRHHADLLVIADGFEIAAGQARQFRPLQSFPGNVIAHRFRNLLSL
jgi:hypothetical protein